MNIKDIKLIGANLFYGETFRMTCPVCGGGSTNEKSLVITRDTDSLLFICHRDSCSVKGKTSVSGSSIISGTEGNFKPKEVSDSIQETYIEIPSNILESILEVYSILKAEILEEGWLWNPSMETLVFPLRDLEGRRTGTQQKLDKRFSKRKGLKSRTDSVVEEPVYYACKRAIRRNYKECILVEDPISAVKCSYITSIPTIGLLGTNMGNKLALGLQKKGVTKLHIMLDRDTWWKDRPSTLEIINRYKLLFDDIVPHVLEKDPKIMTAKEILRKLNKYEQ